MKKILIVFSIIIGLTNCQLVDVLEQDPMYELDLENAITSPEMAELALTGLHAGGLQPAIRTGTAFWGSLCLAALHPFVDRHCITCVAQVIRGMMI